MSKEKKKKSKKNIIIGIILGLLVIALLGYILYNSVIWPNLNHCKDEHLVCNETKTICYTYKETAGKGTVVKWRGSCAAK